LNKPSGINPYLKTKIMTASAEELRMMLYDGCLKFCRQAREAVAAGDYEKSFDNLMRAQKIVLELSTSLKHEAAPELCDKLAALYTYIYKLLVDANMHRTVAPIDEAIELIGYERETWQLLIERLKSGETLSSEDHAALYSAQQTAMSSLQRSA